MKTYWRFLSVSIPIGLLVLMAAGLTVAQRPAPSSERAAQSALGSAFTYQGQLNLDGQPVDDSCQMAFRLYDDAGAGNQVGTALTRTVAIADGLFTAQLDFGAGVFTGDARWLGIGVQCTGDAGFADLGRQALTAVPYALHAVNAATADLLDGQDSSFYRNASNISSGTLDTDYYSAHTDLGVEGYLGNAAGDLAQNNGAVQTNLNADLVDGKHASQFGVTDRYSIPGGAAGTVTMTIPHYNTFQITIGEAFGSPNKVGWVSIVENDGDIAWIGIQPDGTVVHGTASLGSTNTILTIGTGITLRCPGNGEYELVLTSTGEDVRAFLTW